MREIASVNDVLVNKRLSSLSLLLQDLAEPASDFSLICPVDLLALSPLHVTAYILMKGRVASANAASAGRAERDDLLT